jgi:arsenate reductase
MADACILYNGRCSKCRGALDLLKQRGVAAEVVEYLAAPPSVADLERYSRLLRLPALQMMRTDEPRFTELGLKTTDQRTEAEWFRLIHENPILLQRPIVVIGDRAVIARPAERVAELFA